MSSLLNLSSSFVLAATSLVVSGSGASAATVAPVEEAPLRFQRRAAQLIEEVRDNGMAPEWADAQLNGEAQAFYRPDVDGVAYIEFDVEPGGFILVSTGEHDFPVPHWNHVGPSISERLEDEADGADIARFYKLDALAYAAEGPQGDRVSIYGEQPFRINGHEALEHLSIDELRNANAAALDLDSWSSWQEMKDGYESNYHALINALRDEASSEWMVEKSIAQKGRSLGAGQVERVALMDDDADFRVVGKGARFVEFDRIDGASPGVEIRVSNDIPAGERVPFEVQIRHANGRNERVRFFVDGLAPKIAESASGPGTLGGWSSWTYYWAGNSGDQRDYRQFTIDGCASGCGSTAWTMLIGWADNQADEGNAYWAPRNGLYRINGGYGADAVAPSSQTTGIVNVQTEIREYIDTFCITGSGATLPADMDEVDEYFVGRTGTDSDTHYNVLGIAETRLREYARNSIRDRDTPAVIGTGWLTHYPLAWGYAWRSKSSFWGTSYSRWFYVNQGWSGTGDDGWVSASTWFAGEIYP